MLNFISVLDYILNIVLTLTLRWMLGQSRDGVPGPADPGGGSAGVHQV